MERDRKGRLPWTIVLLILVFSCAIAFVGAKIWRKAADKTDFASVRAYSANALQDAQVVDDGAVLYDGSSITRLGTDTQSRWSYLIGGGAEYTAGNAGVAAWVDESLTLIEDKTGTPSYSGKMEQQVLAARMGAVYAAVQLGPEHNSTIVLMETGGKRVDSITLADQTVVDFGFFYNDTLFWVMTLDANGTVPSCTISTYRPGRRIVGSITDNEQVLYHVMFQSTQICCAGDTHLKVYDYNGKEETSKRKLVYGWFLADADEAADNPMMAFVPDGQYDVGALMKDVMMIRGDQTQTVRMPFGCEDVCAKGDRVYGFSSEGYVMIAQMGQQKANAYRLNAAFDEVCGVTANGVAILRRGNTLYFVSLQ